MKNLLEKAKKLKAQAEIFALSTITSNIDVRNNSVESADELFEQTISIRIIKDGKLGFGYTTDIDPSSLEDLLENTIKSAGYSEADLCNTLPNSSVYEPLITFDRDISELSTKQKIDFALSIEQSAYLKDQKIKKTEKISFTTQETKVQILNTNDLSGTYHANFCGGSCDIIAEDISEQESGSYVLFSSRLKEFDPKLVGSIAADKACELLGGKPIFSMKVPLVLDPSVGAQLLMSISNLFSADAVQKKRSLLAGKLGKNIASNKLTIIDNGRLKNGIASSPFDDEGIPTQETILIKSGILENFLYNCFTAQKEKRISTGNGRRASYKSLPEVAPSNLYIEKGNLSQEKIISSVSKGIYITRVMGMHTINPVSGDFSIGATGIMVENGQRSFPVKRITIAGNLIDLLQSIEEVGDDLRFFPFSSNLGSPTLLVSNISIGG